MLVALATSLPSAAPILWTWLPTNTAVNGYGASAALRRDYNDLIRAMATRGQIVADFDAALSGAADGAGQIQIKAGSAVDGIHPSDSGNQSLAQLLAHAVRANVKPSPGMLVR